MRPELKQVHLQLTRACNLRCVFCGQDHNPSPGALAPGEWLALLDRIRAYAPGARLTLWGGEPLLYPGFEAVARRAAELGFPLELVTNGVLIDRHAPSLKSHFEKIHVSVDGPEAEHDAIRGAGVFAALRRNLPLLKPHGPELVMMSVMTPENMSAFDRLPFGLPVDRVILHPMIYLTEEECAGQAPGFGAAWRKNAAPGYARMREEAVARLRGMSFPVPVEFRRHGAGGKCREPYRHLHIGAEGETSFCTDFTDESLGNVRSDSLAEIFEGARAQAFRRRGETPYCAHCSWKRGADEAP